MTKNHRKTLGLLRDLRGRKSVGVIAEDTAKGVIEIARPVGVVGAVTPSTNPAATPANKIINAIKGRNAIILSPSPKGYSTGALLLQYIGEELDRIGAPRDVVQQLPAPVTRAATQELMRQVDLVVVTGSQNNVRAAYASGTPAIGVGAGNVAVIIDETCDVDQAALKIRRSKTFDNATSCSSENSLVIVDAVYGATIGALLRQGAVLLDAAQKQRLQDTMWPDGKLSPAVTAKSAPTIAALAGLQGPEFEHAQFLMVEETGVGDEHPFSGEKLSPVLAVYRVGAFAEAMDTVRHIYAHEGAGHSIGIHTEDLNRPLQLGLQMPACRIIVNQAHCFATGGSFDNGLPFSLSMGCGTWGHNSISDNLNYKHFLNITRIATPCAPDEPSLQDIFGDYKRRHGLA
ncbi:sulfoacetaldehyde dehydrogenase (acylating) [mine drainage metagenome]|uniref:Sulfoacetaldehyde dehydrogenase (Acylating) n=1 Tax=mine drainage metagenome TaxID=410659 RepID=A0A1J5PQT6_9ZZZZ